MTKKKSTTVEEKETKSCILTTSLATVNTSYRAGDTYTSSPAEVARLIDRNMATPIED